MNDKHKNHSKIGDEIMDIVDKIYTQTTAYDIPYKFWVQDLCRDILKRVEEFENLAHPLSSDSKNK